MLTSRIDEIDRPSEKRNLDYDERDSLESYIATFTIKYLGRSRFV